MIKKSILVTFAIAFALSVYSSAFADTQTRDIKKVTKASKASKDREIAVSKPPFSEGVFPCSGCHAEMEPNPKRRELLYHDDIILEHDEEHRWCLDCHEKGNRDYLHSASGEQIEFTESQKLCAQCHGPKYRDWKAGIHGKRTGQWQGEKEYFLCVNCHNPHSPKFKPVKPELPPVRPEKIK